MQRIGADLDDLRAVFQVMAVGQPGHQMIDHDDEIGIGQIIAGIGAAAHRAFGRDRIARQPPGADRRADELGEIAKRIEAARIVADAMGDDHRRLGRENHLRRPLEVLRVRAVARGREGRRRIVRLGTGRAQGLARQRQINRAARIGHRDAEGAVHEVRGLLRHAQLEIPFDRLAHQGGLVVHVLAPIDRRGAMTEMPDLAHRRAARAEQHRDMIGGGIDRAHHGVGQADIGVHHQRLGAAGREIITMRHRDRGGLVRRDQRLGDRHARDRAVREGLDDRRKIGPAIGEEIIDAMGLEALEKNFGGGGAGGFDIGWLVHIGCCFPWALDRDGDHNARPCMGARPELVFANQHSIPVIPEAGLPGIFDAAGEPSYPG